MSEIDEAIRLSQRDARTQMLIQSCVGSALNEHGPIDPEHADYEAHRIAIAVATLLAKRIYEADAELRGLRDERDHYKAVAERSIQLFSPLIIKADAL